ncbi:type I-B CRISPR-associated endonuclease Cas1 [Coprothermobacteraceae bacterium]|nr:type I-B CRISPR-associated endonuclease Cas1 [Coprothermobacteraceae bacterium]
MSKVIYIFKSGKLSRKDNTLCFETVEGERKFIPIENTREIQIFGEITLNKDVLELLCKYEITLHFYNYYTYYVGSFYPREHYNSGFILVKQVQHYLDTTRRVKLAAAFLQGAVSNMIKVLAYYNRRDVDLQHEISILDTFKNELVSHDSIPELMALEGRAREVYYSCFDKIVATSSFSFGKRTRRPPENQMNALISFGNSLLYTTVLSEIYKTHLDPRIGYLHESNFRSFSLNLDIAEVFKPIIVDRAIFALINKGILKDGSFERRLGGLYLSEAGAREFVQEFDSKLESTMEHRTLGRRVSYRTLIRMEAYKIEKHIIGEKSYEPYEALW